MSSVFKTVPEPNLESLELLRLLFTATNSGKASYLPIPRLLLQGWREPAVRWLLATPWVNHLQEVAPSDDGTARVAPSDSDALTGGSCIALTTFGKQAAQELLGDQNGNGRFQWPQLEALLRPAPHPTPFYDAELRRLWLGPKLVKEFLRPAANQELLLAAFQEQGWPVHMDDPLPPTQGIEPKSRFAEAVKQLNRHQKARVLSFHRCASSTKVKWSRL